MSSKRHALQSAGASLAQKRKQREINSGLDTRGNGNEEGKERTLQETAKSKGGQAEGNEAN